MEKHVLLVNGWNGHNIFRKTRGDIFQAESGVDHLKYQRTPDRIYPMHQGCLIE